MPLRSSESEEPPTDSRRSSLHRLVSIASFPALNPFHRRRSNNTDNSSPTATATTTATASHLSLASTIVHAPQSHKKTGASTKPSPIVGQDDDLTALPLQPSATATSSHRSSYICLPDDPLGGMPRSRTFSNLPLPSRMRKTTPLLSSQPHSHSRIPSLILPSTRIPTPPMSNRRHSNSKAYPAQFKQPLIKTRMKRSDTEPLLPVHCGQPNSIGRSTAFKENFSTSPIKPLPPMYLCGNKDLYGSSLPSRTYASRHGWTASRGEGDTFVEVNDFLASLPLSHYDEPSVAELTQSSPGYRSFREGPGTPGASRLVPVQRWNSQPILADITNRRDSRHAEIKQRRLLTEVNPPGVSTPPASLTADTSTREKRKSLTNPLGHIRQVLESSPSLARLSSPSVAKLSSPSLTKLSSKSPHSSPKHKPGEECHPQHLDYWAARLSTLNDRCRTAELHTHLLAPKSESDKMHSPEANTRRLRRGLEYLYACCATSEARESLVLFQLRYAGMVNEPELARPLVLKRDAEPPEKKKIHLGRQEASGESGNEYGIEEGRRSTFMDRLLRKRAKKGAV